MGGSARKLCASCSPAIHLPRAERRPYTPWTLACGIAATRKPALSAYYYHPSRHSAGQPIVAGWAYQFVAQLGFVRESWTAPVDVQRVLPAQDANEVAAQQIEALVGRLEEGEAVPLFVFDAFSTIPSRCSERWRGAHARYSSACGRGGASTAILASATRRSTSDAPVATDRR